MHQRNDSGPRQPPRFPRELLFNPNVRDYFGREVPDSVAAARDDSIRTLFGVNARLASGSRMNLRGRSLEHDESTAIFLLRHFVADHGDRTSMIALSATLLGRSMDKAEFTQALSAVMLADQGFGERLTHLCSYREEAHLAAASMRALAVQKEMNRDLMLMRAMELAFEAVPVRGFGAQARLEDKELKRVCRASEFEDFREAIYYALPEEVRALLPERGTLIRPGAARLVSSYLYDGKLPDWYQGVDKARLFLAWSRRRNEFSATNAGAAISALLPKDELLGGAALVAGVAMQHGEGGRGGAQLLRKHFPQIAENML